MSLEITSKSNVRVQWKDKIENYSKERINSIKKHIKNKYNLENSVRVDFIATNKINLGVSNVETGEAENINTPEVQEKIILGWLKDNRIDITIDDIRRLNKRVENELVDFNDTKDNKWVIKSLSLENFLSYGEKTVFDFEKLKGITLIQGANFVGKTTVLEALTFLLFNTTTKTSKADEIINRFNDAEFAKVEGELIIDGVEYKIERTVKRKWKKDRSSYTTSTDLKFMTKDASGEYIESDKEEDRKATDKKIKQSIGNYKEFLMTIVCTGDTIFDVIKAKNTERGQLLTRYLGLEIFEKKEEIAKKMYSDWKLKSKIDKYNISDLQVEIENNNTLIKNNEIEIESINKSLKIVESNKDKANKEKDTLSSQYYKDIDSSMVNRNEDYYLDNIKVIDNKILIKENELLETKNKKITDLPEFDKDNYDKNLLDIASFNDKNLLIDTEVKTVQSEIRTKENSILNIEGDNKVLNNELTNLRATVIKLKTGTNCPECGQKLENVDHTEVIKTKTQEGIGKKTSLELNLKKIDEIKIEIEQLKNKITVIEENKQNNNIEINRIKGLNDTLLLVKEKITKNDIILLTIDKINVEIEILTANKEKAVLELEKFKNDLEKIIKNKELDENIRLKNIEIASFEESMRNHNREKVTYETNNGTFSKKNEENEILIDTLRKEEHINKIFLVYLNLVGKNGISKTILRNSVPVLNMELDKLLKDSAEFTIEIEINEKNNEVEFWIIDNETGIKGDIMSGSGYEKTVGSLAIRIVNAKINALPKPSLLIIDEIFSTVSVENLELVKLFIDKVSNSMDNVIMITHNELVKEWADHIITINKVNRVSKAMF